MPLTVKPGDQSDLRRKLLPKGKAKKAKNQNPKTRKTRKTKKSPRKKSKTPVPKASAKRRARASKGSAETSGEAKGEAADRKEKVKKGKKIENEEQAVKKPRGRPRGSSRADPPNGDEAVSTFGCSRCRFAALGCKTCKRVGFRPRGRRAARSTPADDDKDVD